MIVVRDEVRQVSNVGTNPNPRYPATFPIGSLPCGYQLDLIQFVTCSCIAQEVVRMAVKIC